jgi:hypothetical protein
LARFLVQPGWQSQIVDLLKAPWVFNKEMPEGGHERRMFENLLRTMVSYYPCATAASVVASEWYRIIVVRICGVCEDVMFVCQSD